MRLFIAVNFDDAVLDRLVELQERLRAQALRGNYTRRENLHLTAAFLGETPPDLLPAIEGCVSAGVAAGVTGGGGPFTLVFSRTGRFVHSRKELWWAGPEAGSPGVGQLAALRGRLCAALDAAGVSFDRRPFSAHVTLGREIRPGGPVVLPAVEIAAPVRRLSLIESRREGGVLRYRELFGQEL